MGLVVLQMNASSSGRMLLFYFFLCVSIWISGIWTAPGSDIKPESRIKWTSFPEADKGLDKLPTSFVEAVNLGRDDAVAPSIINKEHNEPDASTKVILGKTPGFGEVDVQKKIKSLKTQAIFMPSLRSESLRYASFEPFVEPERPLPLDTTDDSEKSLQDKRSLA